MSSRASRLREGGSRRFAAHFRAHGGHTRRQPAPWPLKILFAALALAFVLVFTAAAKAYYTESASVSLLGSGQITAFGYTAGLRYWERAPSAGTEFPLRPKAPVDHERYVTFEDDTGGWNNIRLAFEVFVVAAKVTGRILVLPPRCRWYLLDRGPITTFAKRREGQTSGYEDYYDFSVLSKQVQVISTEEFLRREAARMGIPEHLVREASHPQAVSNGHHTEYFLWLRESPDALIWPSGPSYKRDFDIFNPDIEIHSETKVLHFPMHVSRNLRYLSGVPAFFDHKPRAIAAHQAVRKFCRETFVYAPHIVRAAEAYIMEMGGFGTFSALHVRRNELQYKNAFADGSVTADNVRALLKSGERVYIATDETEEGFFDRFRELGIEAIRMPDLRERVYARMGRLDPKYEGMVEQLVCAAGRIFVGTMYSSFTAHIHRLRGYMHSESQTNLRASEDLPSSRGFYFHTTDYNQPGAIAKSNRAYAGNFDGEVKMSYMLEN
ncbi:GDP-fucose protein O-fucosyltransferase 2 [Hondaea fermentalgiana]|uniref:GDP-fucose protein O-fucosyltransferase 2 n=1 Tax=Hondaea fermentalgiana TaxID=2315210 RepID=A0A2R5G802_9STRA|nr:GDP-fucose protein O-fucosyltransferase 2 [Hondaea fermentalgiana]|eukprot:GBG26449.1 GDP-fucose protein O-fucosyltransferase 2 [Hondaea fermentalgiana]